MKTEFQFEFVSGRAIIKEAVSIRFGASGVIGINRGEEILSEPVSNLPIEVRLVPEESEKHGHTDGRLLITIPGGFEEHRAFASSLAGDIAEHLAFFYEGFHILGGFVMARFVPETDGEAARIGDKPYTGEIRLVEVDSPLPFDREDLRLFPYSLEISRTIRQFNSACSAKSIVDRFLGMFKVLETLFVDRKQNVRKALRNSSELISVLRGSHRTSLNGERFREPTDVETVEFIDTVVATRHACAHLQERNAFGFAPHDSEVYKEVEPLYEIIRGAARGAIDRRLRAKRDGRGGPGPPLPKKASASGMTNQVPELRRSEGCS